MMHVVEAVAPLHAQAAVVRGTVATLHAQDPVVLDVIGELATHAAVRAHRVDGPVGFDEARAARRHERARRARLHAFAARDARRCAHGIVEIEYRHRREASIGVADHVVDLHLAARPHAARALDAGVEVHRDRGMRKIGFRREPRAEAGLAHLELARPVVELRIRLVRCRRHVGLQQLEHHLLRMQRALAHARHVHAGLGRAAARRRERALAVDLDHAGATVAVGPHPLQVAKMRDVDAVALRRLDDGLAGQRPDRLPVERELDEGLRGSEFDHVVHCHAFLRDFEARSCG